MAEKATKVKTATTTQQLSSSSNDDGDDDIIINTDGNNNYNELLKGKVVLITGCNRGIGKSFVDVLLEKCPDITKIYAAVRDVDSLLLPSPQDQDDDDPHNKSKVVPLYMDLSKPSTIVDAASKSSDVNIIINNAGVLLRTTNLLDEQTVSNLQTELQVNVFGLLHLAQQYIPIILQNNNNSTTTQHQNSSSNNNNCGCGGWFIQINSVASYRCGFFDVATYSASKAAAYSITQAIQQQLNNQIMENGQNTIKVLSVHPGPIATDMILQSKNDDLIKQAEDPQNVVLEVLKGMMKQQQQQQQKEGNDEAVSSTPSSSSLGHVFPDKKSKQLSNVLEPYVSTVIEDGKMYG